MSKTNKNKTNQTKQNIEQGQNRQNSHSFSDLYSSDIVKAFAEKMDKKNPNFLPTATKEKTIQEFEQFVKEEYDDNILQALKNGKISGNSIDIELNKIVDKGFTLDDLLSSTKSSVIKNSLGHITSEANAISHGIVQCYKQWQNLTTTTKNSLKFDDFIREIGYKSQTDPEGNIISVSPGTKGKGRSLSSIMKTWKDFVGEKMHNSNDITLLVDMMNFDHFDPTEKVACVSAVRGLNHQIDLISKGDNKKKQVLTDIWGDVFSNDALYNPVGAHMGWTSIDGLERHMADFFQQIAVSGVVTKKDIEQLKNIAITSKSCVLVGEQSGDLPRGVYDEQLKNKRFSELSQQLQSMVNTFTQIDLINNISDVIEQVETDIDNYAKVFDIPGNMAHFFDQFGLPSAMEVDRNSYEYKLHYSEYKRKNKELHDFIKAHTGEFQSDSILQKQKESLEQEVKELQFKINPHAAYLSLKQQKERIKDELSKSHDHQRKQDLIKKLSDIDVQLIHHKQTTQISTRDQYFNHIANQVDTSIEILGSGVLHGEQVVSILKKLQSKNRDVSQLSHPDEHNILMQASINIQLMNVKNSDINTTIGYEFQEYASFVSGLYDLRTPSQSIIITKDKEPITLNFNSKKFVGKPLERHNIDVLDVSSLKNIRVEFELDLNNNPDAEEFIRIMTGGDRSQIIEDFLPAKDKNFPKTITDSTLVKMIDKSGKVHEGYLSRYEFPEDDIERSQSSTSEIENRTYVLYDKPADQLHADRKVKLRGKSDNSEKSKPVYINMDNIDERESVEILDKKVTLSDQHLKALTLGHMVAQSLSKDDFLDPKNSPQIQDLINEQDETLMNALSEDHRDKNTNSVEQETVEESEDKEQILSTVFTTQRNQLVGGSDKNIPCKEGIRFALKPKIGRGLPSIPEGEQLMSGTVKKITYDNNNNPIAFTLSFDNLSRHGKCSMKDIVISADKISNLKEVFDVKYLDDISNPQDYKSILGNLQSTFDNKKSYNRGIFSDLSFDGKEFKRGKEPITKFISQQATEDATKSDKKKYNVEYTIKKVGDRYHVQSTPFAALVSDGSGENPKTEKKNIVFDTTTDLNGLLLILAGKKLTPYTKEEEKRIGQVNSDGDTLPVKDTKRYSLATIWAVIKSGGKPIIDGLKKKRGEDQEAEVKHILFGEMNIYRKLQNKIGGIFGTTFNDVLDDLADESEQGMMESAWKKIDGFYQHLLKFHPAWNAGPNTGGLAIAEAMMEGAYNSYEKTGICSYEDRLKTAGVMMYMLDKMKSGYSKNFSKYPRGTYVKLLLGPKAYAIFTERYKDLETKAQQNTEEGQKFKEQLTMFEYNFIVDSTRGGPNTDNDRVRSQNGNPFYYQGLYNRKFANELGKLVGGVKEISADKNSEGVKGMIAANNFNHVYNECRDHIGQLRVADAVAELVALQQVASTKEQGDKVIMLMMAGILNGAFVHHLGKGTKEQLKGVFRNSSIPFPQWIEHADGPQKIQAMLELSTADMGGNAFSNFSYKDKKGNSKNYDFSEFDPTHGDKGQMEGFVGSFEKWMSGSVEDRVISFLHMDPESLQSDNNLIKIWKSHDPELQVFGHKVDPFAKQCVNEMMGELYLNRSRRADLDNYNFGSGLTHTATTIENFYRDSVNKYKGEDRDVSVGDHAGTVWSNLKDYVPQQQENSKNKDMLAYHVNEFFRVFQGMGSIDYDSGQIDTFYKNLRLAKDQKNLKDKKRLIWFEMTKLLYARGSVPEIVTDTFVKYMQYFEKNLDNFDRELGSLHSAPGDHSKNFEHSFTSHLDDEIIYIPNEQWRQYSDKQKNELYRQYENEDKLLMNMSMVQSNKSARGNSRNYNTGRILGTSIDKKIHELTGSSIGGDDDIKSTADKLVNVLNIDTTNGSDVDLSVIKKPEAKIINISEKLNKQGTNNQSLEDKIRELQEKQETLEFEYGQTG